tara:strand:- start:1965 stop:2261 length:297 start_codon:yes stop_codon:yes gene_type:complete
MAYDKPFEPKPNTGILSPSKEKRMETSPDYYGNILIDVSKLELVNGVGKIQLSGWKKKSLTTGAPYLSLSVSPFKERTAEQPRKPAASVQAMDDDIPF